jgi:hypothetical protein
MQHNGESPVAANYGASKNDLAGCSIISENTNALSTSQEPVAASVTGLRQDNGRPASKAGMSDLHPLDHPGLLDCDPHQWSPLQRQIVQLMDDEIDEAPVNAFLRAVGYVRGLYRGRLILKQQAVDLLHEIAIFYGLAHRYGHAAIQEELAEAFDEAEVAA